MVKKNKLLLLMLLCILVVSTILAGCKSNEQTNSEAETGGNNGSEKGEPYEIVMAYMELGNTTDLPLVQEEINKIAIEKINAKVKLLPINWGAWAQQTNLMMTGNEKLDLIVSSQYFGYSTQAAKGQLLPLNELIEKHGQGIKEAIPQEVLGAAEINGEVYGVPSVRDWAADYGFIMRKDLVDKYNINLAQLKSYEDLESVFSLIKENEPSMVPIANTTQGVVYSNLTGGKYDVLGDALGVIAFDDPDNVINMFEHPDYVEAVNMARKWYQAGYISKDAATSQESSPNIVKAGKGFGYLTHMKPGYETQEKLLTGHEMVAVRFTEPYSYTDAGTGFNLSIPRNSQNPEKAMEFLNLLYTDSDIMNLLANGIEGKHYVVKEEGVITLPEGVTESGYLFGQWMIGNNALTYPWEGNEPDYWETMKEFNNSAILSPAFGFTFNPDPIKTELAALTNVVSQYRTGLETGTLDPAKSLPEFNEKLKAAGLDKVIAEKQRQYDEWRASK